MGLTTTRSHDAAFTYEQMRAVARASVHDNTVAVKQELAWGGDPDYWPGEPRPSGWGVCRDCGHGVPATDIIDRCCLDCWVYEQGRRP
jgi:hypothetical protein